MTNSERLKAKYVGMTLKQTDDYDNFLIGALSALVTEEMFREAMLTADICLKARA